MRHMDYEQLLEDKMTKEEKQKIKKKIANYQQQQIGLRNQSGIHHQAIFEIREVFEQIQARIEELRTFLPEEKEDE